MPRNPFEQTKADTELDTGKLANGKHDATASDQASGKSETSKGAQHPDRVPVGPDAE